MLLPFHLDPQKPRSEEKTPRAHRDPSVDKGIAKGRCPARRATAPSAAMHVERTWSPYKEENNDNEKETDEGDREQKDQLDEFQPIQPVVQVEER